MKTIINRIFNWMGYIPKCKPQYTIIREQTFQMERLCCEKTISRAKISEIREPEFWMKQARKQMEMELFEGLKPFMEWQKITDDIMNCERMQLIVWVGIKKN